MFVHLMEGQSHSIEGNHLNSRLIIFIKVLFLLASRSDAEVFLGKEILYQLEEEVPVGTKLADIMTDAGLTKLYKPQEIRKMTLRFNSDPAIPLFIKNGIVRTNGRIDRESISVCRVRDPCELSVDVTVQPYEYFRVIKMIVEILDVNDNAPTFQTADDSDSAEVSIIESAAQGTSVILPSATDSDSPRYGIAGYQLLMVAGITAFHLKVTMKVEGVLEACLVVNEKLDREKTPFYSATLVAYDGGTPTKSVSLNLMIVVLDANDNDPTFDKNYYELRISENAKFNETVAYLRATDVDHGKNAEIRYSLAAQSPQSPTESFGIDEETGRLFVMTALDRELNDKCQLVVSARDLGIHSRQTNVLVTVHVEDVNDNSPEISINSLSLVASNAASVPENAPPGTFIAHLTAIDRDLGKNGSVQCYLQNDETRPEPSDRSFHGIFKRELFHLERQKLAFVRGEQEYHLLTSSALDRELVEKYQVNITCIDEGLPPQSSSASMEIVVTDENDNDPTFSAEEYEITIPESSSPGSVITHVSASDTDSGKNGKVTYKLSGPLAEYFNIDTSGNIFVSQPLSREPLGLHKLVVLGMDHGEPRRTGTTLLTVNTSSDLHLANSTFFFRVAENQPRGTTVGRVIIGDDDKHVQYEIKELEEFQLDAFKIDSQTGFLVTNKVLDREIHPVHHVWVHEVPSENKTEFSTPPKKISVTVFVEDLNDNDPLFVFPSPNNFTVFVPSKNFRVGSIVARVNAIDRDSGKNAEVEYSLKDCLLSNDFYHDGFHLSKFRLKFFNNSSSALLNSTLHNPQERNWTQLENLELLQEEFFRIDPDLGNVHVKKVPEPSEHSVFHLTILATDRGNPERSNVALLTIILNSTTNGVHWSSNIRISNQTMTLLGFVAGTCLVVFILTILVISIVFFRKYSTRQPDKPSGQTPSTSSAIKHSPASNIAFSVISSAIRCLSSRGCVRGESRNQSEDDLLRRSVPCIQVSLP